MSIEADSTVIIGKVAYGVTIGDNKFGNSRPGIVEATLKPGKTLEEALDELDDRLNAWHRRRYPKLYEEGQQPEITRSTSQLVEIQTERSDPNDTLAALIADIYTCTELKVLEGYRLLAKTKPELKAAYDQMIIKLSVV